MVILAFLQYFGKMYCSFCVPRKYSHKEKDFLQSLLCSCSFYTHILSNTVWVCIQHWGPRRLQMWRNPPFCEQKCALRSYYLSQYFSPNGMGISSDTWGGVCWYSQDHLISNWETRNMMQIVVGDSTQKAMLYSMLFYTWKSPSIHPNPPTGDCQVAFGLPT